MGTKYESSPIEVVLGFSGQIRPGLSEGGMCAHCAEIVFVDASASAKRPSSKRIEYRHHGCAS